MWCAKTFPCFWFLELIALLGNLYFVMRMLLDPSALRLATGRPRQIVVLVLKPFVWQERGITTHSVNHKELNEFMDI